jgi:ech hydrogenase subunit D
MNIEMVENSALFERVAAIGSLGYRLVQICCTRISNGMELTYSFGKDSELLHVRTAWSPGGSVPSIQPVYGCAFVYENEIAELFGVTVSDMLVDFKGQLYKSAQPSPFGPGITIQEG